MRTLQKLMVLFTLLYFSNTNSEETDMMQKFDFLLGDWNLEYRIPESQFSSASTGSGSGTFVKALDDKYVFFDYVSLINGETGQAHGIFGWDDKAEIYRYWWFESSGNYSTADCKFTDEKTLYMIWRDSHLIQTFTKINPDTVELKMENPKSEGGNELVMKVILTRK